MRFFADSSDATIASTLNAREIGFARDDSTLAECNPAFPEGDRNTWRAFDGEFYFIEKHGRPNRAYKCLPPIVEADRIETCQGNVGTWGDSEDESNDYDGRHMIGSQLGGCGGRVNLVPQDLTSIAAIGSRSRTRLQSAAPCPTSEPFTMCVQSTATRRVWCRPR
jgi:hypothetical protein